MSRYPSLNGLFVYFVSFVDQRLSWLYRTILSITAFWLLPKFTSSPNLNPVAFR